MGLGYTFQSSTPIVCIGSKVGTTRTSATLTTGYDVATKTKILPTGGVSKINYSILYTTGSAETNNSIEVRIRTSADGTNFYQIVNESASSGTSTLYQREFTFVGASAATAYAFSLPLDVQDRYMEISVKESGVASNAGTVYVEATLSGAK